MALRGAVPLGSPTPPPRGWALVRRRTQPWRYVDLAWGEHTMRSLLLYATAMAGAFAGFALPSMLSQPADFSTVMSLRVMSFVLFTLGLVVAPTRQMNRAIAAFALALHVAATIGRTVIIDGGLPQPVTYGEIDAFRFISVATLLAYWMVLRMRHPLSVSATAIVFCAISGTFFLQGSMLIRAFVEAGGIAEQTTSLDETLIWSITGVTAVATLVLCAWLDGYTRAYLPLRGYDYRAIRTPVLPDDRGSVLRDYRVAWVCFWLLLDVPAIIFIVRAMRRPLGLEGDREWYARVLLPLATARLTMALVGVTAALIMALDPAYRAFAGA